MAGGARGVTVLVVITVVSLAALLVQRGRRREPWTRFDVWSTILVVGSLLALWALRAFLV